MDGKVALVTGAAQGIGYAITEALLKKGAKVCIADFDVTVGEKAVSGLNNTYGSGRVVFIKCDVTCLDDMEAAFAKTKSSFGRIDIVCNNAGISSEDKWQRMVAINFNGVVQGTQLAIGHMRKDKGGDGGTIMNIASIAGLIPASVVPVYCGTKHAVLGYTRSLAEHPILAANGLKFVTLCPNFVQTPLGKDIYEGFDAFPEVVRDMVKGIVDTQIGWLSPDDIAKESMALLLDETPSGAVLVVSKNGGAEFKTFEKPFAMPAAE